MWLRPTLPTLPEVKKFDIIYLFNFNLLYYLFVLFIKSRTLFCAGST